MMLGITNDPIHNPAINEVWPSISEMQYNLGSGDTGWHSRDDFRGPQSVNPDTTLNVDGFVTDVAEQCGETTLPDIFMSALA